MSSTKITEFDLDTSADIAKESTLRENFETLDCILSENESAVGEINEKIGTNTDTDSTTIFGQLNNVRNTLGQDVSLIKSIQRVTYSIEASKTSGSVSINEVDPTKCFVIFERLQNLYTSEVRLEYTLNATSLTFKHESNDSANLRKTLFGFWIIEFN